jgi:hypothetical protein
MGKIESKIKIAVCLVSVHCIQIYQRSPNDKIFQPDNYDIQNPDTSRNPWPVRFYETTSYDRQVHAASA